MKQAKKLLTLILIAAFIISALPLTGAFDVQAKSKAAKKIKLSGCASGTSAVVLNWNKIKKPEKGYAVFMDGNCIATFGKKTTSHVAYVAPGSSHSFQIKVWKKVTKKKKVNGKKKRIKVYKYSKGSNVVSVATPAPVNTGTASGPSESNPAPTTNRTAITVTDYKGDKTTLYKEGNKTYRYPTGGSPMTKNELAKVNKNVAGTWNDGNYTFYQKNGTTLEYKSSSSSSVCAGSVSDCVYVYNGDENRVKMEIQEEVRNFKEYKTDDRQQANPIQVPYVMSADGKYRLGKPFFDAPNSIYFYEDDSICGHDGFIDDTIHVKVWYDWNNDGSWTDDEYVGMNIVDIKATPQRKKALEIAKAAVNYYGTNSYGADMMAISAYIFKNYPYDIPDQASGLDFRCRGGSLIQETWSIYKYNVYGYIGRPYSSNPSHLAFYPIDNPYNNTVFWNAQGYKENEKPGTNAYNETLTMLENAIQ